MLYLNEKNVREMHPGWNECVNVIGDAVSCLKGNDYAQPIKPYLRYKTQKNRIIAMPAYIGGDFNISGIKWIASFPENTKKGIPRAHSVIILNNADTGVPEAIINTALVSIIRTVSVSGFMIRYYAKNSKKDKYNIGIIGFGPIGKNHFDMCRNILKGKIKSISVYDTRDAVFDTDLASEDDFKYIQGNCWQDVYDKSDIVITCTVSDAPYIDIPPMKGSLQLNVSLRDYKTDVFESVRQGIVVDDWDEVCRENTDVERMAIHKGLKKSDTSVLSEITGNDFWNKVGDGTIMFNPMGMGVFDIAIASFFLEKAKKDNMGTILD